MIAHGDLKTVARAAHAHLSEQPTILDDATGRTVDLNLQGSTVDIESRFSFLPEVPKAPRGRPKLGVTSREVTLLPRHWDWLSGQPGGASAALRRLVEQARRTADDGSELRAAQDRIYRAMTTLCGDQPGYEEAIRALFGGDGKAVDQLSAAWPADLRDYLLSLWN